LAVSWGFIDIRLKYPAEVNCKTGQDSSLESRESSGFALPSTTASPFMIGIAQDGLSTMRPTALETSRSRIN
jgi:hypothetical protein